MCGWGMTSASRKARGCGEGSWSGRPLPPAGYGHPHNLNLQLAQVPRADSVGNLAQASSQFMGLAPRAHRYCQREFDLRGIHCDRPSIVLGCEAIQHTNIIA